LAVDVFLFLGDLRRALPIWGGPKMSMGKESVKKSQVRFPN